MPADPTRPALQIMVSAGEASGDAHAAHALQALQQRQTPFSSFGMGAGKLSACGTELIVDCRELSVIGIVDVLINYPRFMQRLKTLRDAMRQRQPDLLLLVDYPNFNLKLAETARELGIPVLFYISPKIWAWRAGRIHRIGKLVSHMAVLFPFEVPLYEQAGIPVSYVGNPVVDDAQSPLTRQQACEQFSVDSHHSVVLLLPGSRIGELNRHLPSMLKAARLLSDRDPHCQFLLPLANTLDRTLLDTLISEATAGNPVANLTIIDGDSITSMRAADVALVASGTATLETALMKTPMVVIYIVSALNYAIMKRLIRLDDIALVNIGAGRRIVPDLLQQAANPQAMADEVWSLIHDAPRRNTMLDDLADVQDSMGDGGASSRVATLIEQLAHAPADPPRSITH